MVKLTASEPSQVKDVMMSIVTLENQPLLPQSATVESQAISNETILNDKLNSCEINTLTQNLSEILKKEDILNKLKELKPIYQNEGLEILGVFGSYAKETNTKYSDIDIAYKLDYDKFSKKYIGGFSKILRINEIKDELKAIFKTEVDFVSDSNKKIMKDLIYV